MNRWVYAFSMPDKIGKKRVKLIDFWTEELQMQKLWCCSSARVWGESAMFFGQDVVKLAFPATEILRVYNSLLGVEYLPGRDYRHDTGTACLVRPAGSQIPFLAKEKQFPAAEKCIFYPAPGHNAIPHGVDGRALIFDNQDFFARQQIEIDYQAERIDFPLVISQQGDRLLRWRQKLSGGVRPLKLTFLGDSITYGYNASKVMGSAPWQPCYAELVQQELQHTYGGEMILCNRGVNGSGCRAALKEAEQWLPDCPDLLVIAYGMNDLTSMTPEQYADTIREIMTLARKIILIVNICWFPQCQGIPCGSQPRRNRPRLSQRLCGNSLRKLRMPRWRMCSPSGQNLCSEKTFMI